MVTTAPRRIKYRLHPARPHRVLEWVHLNQKAPNGTLFSPPLIGGSGLLAIRQLRSLTRGDYDLISFNYAGHGQSTPPFSLNGSIRDTRHMLNLALQETRPRRLPLFGIGLCYGSIPTLCAAHRAREPFRGIVLINALPRLFSFNVIRSFRDFCRVRQEQQRAGALTSMLRRYTDRLFPNIEKSLSRFGMLERQRISLAQTLWEAVTRNPLKGIRLANTPVLSIYSHNDPLLGAYRLFDQRCNYEAHIRRLCPQASFVGLQGDHFLSTPEDRCTARQAIFDFLKQISTG